jgi:hypothetical protein
MRRVSLTDLGRGVLDLELLEDGGAIVGDGDVTDVVHLTGQRSEWGQYRGRDKEQKQLGPCTRTGSPGCHGQTL